MSAGDCDRLLSRAPQCFNDPELRLDSDADELIPDRYPLNGNRLRVKWHA